MHEVNAKGILSAQNGMNLCRGCLHGCIYCDARSKCYQMQHAFEDIEIKVNAPELLEDALKRKRKKCMIATGAMSDPYLPLKKARQITRQCLEIIDRYGFGLAIQTKSNHILQDMDLLQSINKKAKCVVEITLTTYDDSLCRRIEPNVCITSERIEVLRRMQEAGITTVVWLSPILPFINDTLDNLTGILEACVKYKVYGIICFGFGLTLREGNREYFYQKLDEHFPGLKNKYIQLYGDAYEISSPNNEKLMREFKRICREHQIVSNPDLIFQYMREYVSHEYKQIVFDFM